MASFSDSVTKKTNIVILHCFFEGFEGFCIKIPDWSLTASPPLVGSFVEWCACEICDKCSSVLSENIPFVNVLMTCLCDCT